MSRTVLFLHGLGGSTDDWAGVSAALPKSLSPLALDFPGFGKAVRPHDSYDPASLARWVLGELDDRDVETALVAGHSLGGRVAGELAMLAPKRVLALALVSPLGSAPYGFTDMLKWKAMSRAALVGSAPDTSIRNALGYGFAVDGAGKKGFVTRAMAARSGPRAPTALRALERSVDGLLSSPPLSKRLAGSKVPLLLVTGADDPLAPPKEVETIRTARPDAKYVKLAGIGHYAPIEAPKDVAKLLAELSKRA
ncbi:MAG TPA: alpha/beta fold hydrolase [Thermoanaerobaculia bacterium]|nr:alpha/beta fold hydrolase [Thermoanaerobaculia bacterium]